MAAASGDDGSPHASKPVTHLAIEGRDVVLREEWEAAALRVARTLGEGARVAQSVDVSPEAWRAALLTPKERKSGVSSKAAARMVARQVVADHSAPGSPPHTGKFKTDAAEAVLVGYHVVRKLKWADTSAPAVRRYTNGCVVMPRS